MAGGFSGPLRDMRFASENCPADAASIAVHSFECASLVIDGHLNSMSPLLN